MDGSDQIISVVMIVKNESERLGACLASLSHLGPLLDEVCVYDTGSTDDTIAIARAHGARVQVGYWDDDFARARNAAAAMATTRWLFVVDADEQVSCDPLVLAGALTAAADGPDGFFVTAKSDEAQGLVETWVSPRIYRTDRLRYTRPVHAMLTPLGDSPLDLWTIPPEALTLLNSGFDTKRLANSLDLKDRLTSRILEGSDETSADPRALMDRGRARMGQGRHEEALSDLLAADALWADEASTYVLWTKEVAIDELLTLGRVEEAARLVDSLEELSPGRAYTRWQRGRVDAALGLYGDAFTQHSNISRAVDAGFSELDRHLLYRECLKAATEEGDRTHIIASLVALTSLADGRADYGPLLARWWGDLPIRALVRAFMLAADHPVAEIAADLIRIGGPAQRLGERLAAAATPTNHSALRPANA